MIRLIFTSVEVEYLKLDDLARVFRKPSIIDVKIGAKTYDPLASKEKVALETSKYPWSQQIGFRILGMRVSVRKLASPHGFKKTLSLQVFDTTEQKYRVYGKDYGLRQTPDTVLEGEFSPLRHGRRTSTTYLFMVVYRPLQYSAPARCHLCLACCGTHFEHMQ